MFATTSTTKEEVDYQFWYPGRNKVIKDYKYIKDHYSWLNEGENEPDFSGQSPKINDLRTPQKKSDKRKSVKRNSDSDMSFDLSEFDITKDGSYIHEEEMATSMKLASQNTSKNILVDLILREESSLSKHTKTGKSYS